MDDDKFIMPLCLYSNNESSLITLPEKVRENDKTVLKCRNIEGMNFETIFYVINPDIKPKPSYLDLFCVKNANNTTVDLFTVYDPYADLDGIRFLAWLEATPCTSPLYVWRKGQKLKITFNENEPDKGYILDEYIPIIFVLAPSTVKGERVGNCNLGDKFTFSISDRRCIPDPKSDQTLGQCMVKINEKLFQANDLLGYLEKKYNNENNKQESKINIKYALYLLIIIILLVIVLK